MTCVCVGGEEREYRRDREVCGDEGWHMLCGRRREGMGGMMKGHMCCVGDEGRLVLCGRDVMRYWCFAPL